jgi:GNAT superfamily N-acetyltransferase
VSEVTVRQATLAEIPELARLRREFTLEDGPIAAPREDFDDAFAAIVADGLHDGRWTIWLAEIDGDVVSHAFVGLIEKIPRPAPGPRWLGYLTNVYTAPAHRGYGIGGRVLEATKTWAAENDVELLVVWLSDQSVSCYERHGFPPSHQPLVWLNREAAE